MFSSRRAALGYKVCLTCGDAKAQKQIQAKQKAIVPSHNKGGFTLLTGESMEQIKKNLLGLTGKGKME